MYNLPLHFKRLLISSLLISFPLATLPTPVHAQLNLADGLFFYNIEKAVEKLIKLEGKASIKKIIEAGLDIKEAVEQHMNIKIDLNHYLDDVEKESKKQGHHFPKGQFKKIKQLFIKDNKKRKDHKGFLACAMYDEAEFSHYLNQKDDLYQPLMAKAHDHKKDDKHDKEEEKIEVPATLVYGVTVSLVGFFIMLLPFPGCKDWGTRIMFMGLSATGGCLSSEAEKRRQEEKDKDKNGK